MNLEQRIFDIYKKAVSQCSNKEIYSALLKIVGEEAEKKTAGGRKEEKYIICLRNS